MKTIDDRTLEAIAELICGSGDGSGGGYKSPGPYRSMVDIGRFFYRSGIHPQGQSSTRKWFVLESLQSANGTTAFDKVLLRLSSPKEYGGDGNVTRKVIDHLNGVLQVEGIQVTLVSVEPQLRERNASMPTPESKETPLEDSPDFHKLVPDSSLADVLLFRWQEAQRCVQGEAYLAAVVMMGSILEGVLLHRFENDLQAVYRANSSPKERGKPRPINKWGLSTLIDVAHEVGWLQGDVKRSSHALRESRNLVHPYMQRLQQDKPDRDTCSICWPVVRAAVSDLLAID